METENELLEVDVMTSPEMMRKKRAEIRRHFIFVSIGVCLIYSGYSAILILQTSVNIEDGTGSVVTSIAYINAVLVSFLVPANLVRFFGVKNSMIMSEFCFVVYLLGNLTSNRIVLQICAIFAGIGDAIFWIPLGLLVVFFSKQYQKYAPHLDEQKSFAKMSGIIFPIFQFNSIVGNAVVFLVLKMTSPPMDDDVTNTTTTMSNMTSPNMTSANMTSSSDYIQFCGANDCQDANTTSAQMALYVPPKRSIYIFISSLIALQLVGICLHCRFVPRFQLHQINRDECDEGEKLTSIWQLTSTIVRTFKLFLFDINQWLLFIPGCYLGLTVAFYLSEISRAYASCTLGVANISALVVLKSSVYCVIQPFWSKLLVRKGRGCAMVVWPVLDTTLYLTCLLWVPTHENAIYVVILIFVLVGITLSNIQLLITIFYTLIFPNNMEISFIFWNISFFCGWTIQFGWSKYLCVYMKIYCNLAALYLAVFSLFILNRRLNRERENLKKAENPLVTSSSTEAI